MNFAPVAFFVYNRPKETFLTVEALKKNKGAEQTDLFVFCDGPKSDKDAPSIAEVRDYVRKIKGFKSVNVIEKEKNFGLATSIVTGVTEIVEKYGRVIVLEDDLVTSPFFLDYVNQNLNLYENENKVASIHAHSFPVPNLPNFYFTRGGDCWGWGTWKRAWSFFEPNGKILLEKIKEKKLKNEFNLGGYYDYYGMLESQIAGKIDSWAIRWHASVFVENMLTLNPGVPYVKNVGFGSTATHTGEDGKFLSVKETQTRSITHKKIPVVENLEAKRKIEKFFKANFPKSLKSKIVHLIPVKLKFLIKKAIALLKGRIS